MDEQTELTFVLTIELLRNFGYPKLASNMKEAYAELSTSRQVMNAISAQNQETLKKRALKNLNKRLWGRILSGQSLQTLKELS